MDSKRLTRNMCIIQLLTTKGVRLHYIIQPSSNDIKITIMSIVIIIIVLVVIILILIILIMVIMAIVIVTNTTIDCRC